jgi:hypothetical protein
MMHLVPLFKQLELLKVIHSNEARAFGLAETSHGEKNRDSWRGQVQGVSFSRRLRSSAEVADFAADHW